MLGQGEHSCRPYSETPHQHASNVSAGCAERFRLVERDRARCSAPRASCSNPDARHGVCWWSSCKILVPCTTVAQQARPLQRLNHSTIFCFCMMRSANDTKSWSVALSPPSMRPTWSPLCLRLNTRFPCLPHAFSVLCMCLAHFQTCLIRVILAPCLLRPT
jgi:hypothetical protein